MEALSVARAISAAVARNDLQVVRVLVSKCDTQDIARNLGKEVIHMAILAESSPVVRLLLDRGADPNTQDRGTGLTALSLASGLALDSIARLLLKHNADLELRDDGQDGFTPLSWAAKKGNETTARLLLEKGAQVDARDHHGLTPLLIVAKHGHGAVVKALLDYGASAREADEEGLTALHYAAMGGFRSTARVLLDHTDVEPWLADKSGKTPVDLARSQGYKPLIELLEAQIKGRG
jgi:ankyrin repeat protein